MLRMGEDRGHPKTSATENDSSSRNQGVKKKNRNGTTYQMVFFCDQGMRWAAPWMQGCLRKPVKFHSAQWF